MLLPATERERLFVQGRSIQHFFQSASRDSGALLSCAASVEGVENCRLVTNGDPPSEAPAGQSLDDLEMRLMSQWLLNASWQPDIRYFLRRALHGVPVTEQCDLVLLDCPPRLTTACVNALAASDFVLIPVQPDAVALRSVGHLLLRLKQLKAAGVLAELRVLGVVANMVAERAFKPKSIESGMLESSCTKAGVFWGQPVPHFRTMLSRMIQYVDASRNLEVGSKLRLAIDFPAVHREYEQLAKEIEGPIYAHLSPAGVPS